MIKNKHAIFFVALLLLTSPIASGSPFSDHDLDSTTIESGEYLAIDLGVIDVGKEIDISFISSEEIDGLLMTDEQYNTWTSGGTDFIRDGSAISQSIEIYTFTVLEAGHYWYVLDNSDQNPGGASSDTHSTITTGGIDINSRLFPGVKTREMVSPGTMASYDLGYVYVGMILDLSISCENIIFDSVDVFVVSESYKSDFESGSDSWNKHASKMDTCLELWSFEVESSDSWTIYVENGPRGEASEDSESLQIDVNLWSRALLPSEITSNTRMIESGEAWEVDLGDVSIGDTMTFMLSLDGLFDELDVLILESDQADIFLSGQTATVLGHPSLIDVDFFDSWHYRFPRAGSYSLILDNSAEPQGGSNSGTAIQAEISVIETTILSDWIGWYQSRHYVEDGSYVSFDLGQLEEDHEFSYIVSGNSHDSGMFASMNAFDVLVFADAEYQNYVNGEQSTHIADYSSLNEWIIHQTNVVVTTPGHYWIVIDAADGPSGVSSADANGAWTFDFIITSDIDISSPQAEDEHYEMIATNLGSNSESPDPEPEPQPEPEPEPNQDTNEDGLSDIGNAKETSTIPSLSALSTILAITLMALSGISRDKRYE